MNKEVQHLLSLNSDEYASFQCENEGATVGYTTWSQVLKEVNTFVTNPKPESCVDEKISGLEHMMVALLGVMKWKAVAELFQGYADVGSALRYDALVEALRKAGAYQFIEAVCCPKVEQPDLHIDKSKRIPTTIPLRCTHTGDGPGNGRCTRCGVGNSLGIM